MLKVHAYAPPSDEQWSMVVRGARNSWESWGKSDSGFIGNRGAFEMGAADMALLLKLVMAGSDHGKFMRQLPLVLEVTAADYWWREFDTYRIGVEADDITQNSTSQMHVLGKHPFSPEMFSLEDVEPAQIDALMAFLNWHRDRWFDEGGKRKGPDASFWRAMKQVTPDSWNYTRTVSLNYQAARAMYHARRAHRLSEWRHFCLFLAALPYGELITTGAEDA